MIFIGLLLKQIKIIFLGGKSRRLSLFGSLFIDEFRRRTFVYIFWLVLILKDTREPLLFL